MLIPLSLYPSEGLSPLGSFWEWRSQAQKLLEHFYHSPAIVAHCPGTASTETETLGSMYCFGFSGNKNRKNEGKKTQPRMITGTVAILAAVAGNKICLTLGS